MPRGRHRQVSTATRISLLAAICAPALVAVVMAVVAGGATALRIAVLLGVLSAAGAIAWVIRGTTAQQRRLAEETVARRRERERMAEELRSALERSGEHEIALSLAATVAAPRAQRLTPDLFARGAAVLDLLDRRGGAARPTLSSIVPAVRRPPVSSPDLVPAYAASMFGPAVAGRAAEPEPVRATEPEPEQAPAPVRAAAPVRIAEPAAAPITAAAKLVRFADAMAERVDAAEAEPAPVAEDVEKVEDTMDDTPAEDAGATATAEVTRMVQDQVREVSRRMSGVTGAFDYFTPRRAAVEPAPTGFLADELFGSEAGYDALVAGRPHLHDEFAFEDVTESPATPAAAADLEADRVADPVRPPAPAPAPAAVEHRGRGGGVRFASNESDAARQGVPRAKPLPVDLTAHDDTEEMPRIDIRKHA